MFMLVGLILYSLYLTKMYILSCLCCSGVLYPHVLSLALWTYVLTGITNQCKYCSFGLCRRSTCSSQLFSQPVILFQPENQQANHDMVFNK